MGAFIGDACGAFLEFSSFPKDSPRIDEAMLMNGGGSMNTGPG